MPFTFSKKSINLFVLLALQPILPVLAQIETGIGQWRDHYSQRSGRLVLEAQNKIYCANERGMFYFDKSDQTVNRLSNTNGLSDIGVSALAYDNQSKTVVVCYENANVDLIQNNRIINIGDIKRSTFITGAKRINNVVIRNQFAYLFCSFGIVVIDLQKFEVRTTYYPGETTYTDVRGGTFRNDSLFIVANNGVWVSSLNNPFIVFYQGWQRLQQFSATTHSYIVQLNGEIFLSKSSSVANADTVYRLTSGSKAVVFSNATVNDLSVSSERLIVTTRDLCNVIRPSDGNTEYIYTFFQPFGPQMNAAIAEKNDPNQFWIADARLGLVSYKNFDVKVIKPEGPFSDEAFYMTQNLSDVWVTAGRYDASFTQSFNRNGLFYYRDNRWESIVEKNFDAFIPFTDVVGAAINPRDPAHGYLVSWGSGAAEVKNNEIISIYNSSNSSLQSISQGSTVRSGGVTFDKDDAVWFTNAGNNTPVSMRKKDGSWKNFTFSGSTNNRTPTQILCDSSNQKWVLMPGTGILTFQNKGDQIDKWKLLTDQTGAGQLNTNTPLCIAQDLDGQIWVGTSKGVCVFYNPEAVFSDNLPASSRDAQRIIIKTTGFNQYLLESEIVTCILVDGANRKWFGTRNGGIFLVSPDGTEQIHNFSVNNSPLPSNNILSLGMNYKTGELLIGTERGIVSYRGTATYGDTKFGDVYVFPNPVRENYSGPVTVTGLVRDAEVRITDVAGNLVYRAKADGGQLVWNGLRTNGERPATGVYLVFCSNNDGSETLVTKFLYVK